MFARIYDLEIDVAVAADAAIGAGAAARNDAVTVDSVGARAEATAEARENQGRSIDQSRDMPRSANVDEILLPSLRPTRSDERGLILRVKMKAGVSPVESCQGAPTTTIVTWS